MKKTTHTLPLIIVAAALGCTQGTQPPTLITAQALETDPNALVAALPLAAPSVGQSATDPSFGVSIRRLTDRGELGGLATAEYPQLQAINADETRVLLTTEDGFKVLDIATATVTHGHRRGIRTTMPRWSPTEPDVILGFDRRNGTGPDGPIHLQRHRLNPDGTVAVTDVANIGALGLVTLGPAAWNAMSADGAKMPLYGTNDAGVNVAATLDIAAARLGAVVPADDVSWVAVSPSGTYLLVQYAKRGTGPTEGLVAYDAADGSFQGHVSDNHENGDTGRLAGGNDAFVSIAYTNRCAGGSTPCVSVAPLPDALEAGTITPLYQLSYGTYTSCQAYSKPGFCVHSEEVTAAPGTVPFAAEIWLTRFSDGAVLRVAHHRTSSCGYYNQARPTVSQSGRYILFTSDWAAPNCDEHSDLYMIDTTGFLDGFLSSPKPTWDAGLPDVGGTIQPDAMPPDALGGHDAADAGQADVAASNDAAQGGGGDAGVAPAPEPEPKGGCSCLVANDPRFAAGLLLLVNFIVVCRHRVMTSKKRKLS